GDGERMNQVGLARVAHLSAVLEGREHVGPPEQLDVGVRAVGPDFFEQILEANHENRCLSIFGRTAAKGYRKTQPNGGAALTCVFLVHYTCPVSAAAIFLAYRTKFSMKNRGSKGG